MIYLASDHRGFDLKEHIKTWLVGQGVEVTDLGPHQKHPDDDYPHFAHLVAQNVAQHEASKGIVLCGSGIGIAVAANKLHGIRAGTAMKPEQAHAAVHDEDLNILALSADFLTEAEAREITKAFVDAKFVPQERYVRRLEEIKKLEEQNC